MSSPETTILWHMPTLRRAGCGLSRRAVEIARRLVALGNYSITFVVESGKTDVDNGAICGLPVHVLPDEKRVTWHWSMQALARRRAAQGQIRRILSQRALPHDPFISCQPEAISAYRATHGLAPLLFICGGTTLLHDGADESRQASLSAWRRLPYRLDRRWKHENERHAFAAADAVVFDSNHTREMVIDAYAVEPHKCHAVHGGVDGTVFRPATPEQRRALRTSMGLPSDGVVVAWTGRLSSEKNIELLLRALPLCRRPPDAALLVGDGPDAAALRRLAHDDLHLDDTVWFLGEQRDVLPFLHAADIFAFPSRGESFGGALAEAMACGLACIALRPNARDIRTASTEIIDHEQSGLLVDPPTSDAFAAALDRLAADANERGRLGLEASRRASAGFTWAGAASRLTRIISELVQGFARSDIPVEPGRCGSRPHDDSRSGMRTPKPQPV
jgi:glycosyltransferase involved in cell wall biosynthesis